MVTAAVVVVAVVVIVLAECQKAELFITLLLLHNPCKINGHRQAHCDLAYVRWDARVMRTHALGHFRVRFLFEVLVVLAVRVRCAHTGGVLFCADKELQRGTSWARQAGIGHRQAVLVFATLDFVEAREPVGCPRARA